MEDEDVLKHGTGEVFLYGEFKNIDEIYGKIEQENPLIFEDLEEYSSDKEERKCMLCVLVEYMSLREISEEVDNDMWFKLCDKWGVDPYISSDIVREREGGR